MLSNLLVIGKDSWGAPNSQEWWWILIAIRSFPRTYVLFFNLPFSSTYNFLVHRIAKRAILNTFKLLVVKEIPSLASACGSSLENGVPHQPTVPSTWMVVELVHDMRAATLAPEELIVVRERQERRQRSVQATRTFLEDTGKLKPLHMRKERVGYSGRGKLKMPMNGLTRLGWLMDGFPGTRLTAGTPGSAVETRILYLFFTLSLLDLLHTRPWTTFCRIRDHYGHRTSSIV